MNTLYLVYTKWELVENSDKIVFITKSHDKAKDFLKILKRIQKLCYQLDNKYLLLNNQISHDIGDDCWISETIIE